MTDEKEDLDPVIVDFHDVSMFIPGDLMHRGGDLVRDEHTLDEETIEMCEEIAEETGVSQHVIMRFAMKLFHYIWKGRDSPMFTVFPTPVDLPKYNPQVEE
jgi:hypothetical protein